MNIRGRIKVHIAFCPLLLYRNGIYILKLNLRLYIQVLEPELTWLPRSKKEEKKKWDTLELSTRFSCACIASKLQTTTSSLMRSILTIPPTLHCCWRNMEVYHIWPFLSNAWLITWVSKFGRHWIRGPTTSMRWVHDKHHQLERISRAYRQWIILNWKIKSKLVVELVHRTRC